MSAGPAHQGRSAGRTPRSPPTNAPRPPIAVPHPSSNAPSTSSRNLRTFNYRRDNLDAASIFIDVLQEGQWPFTIQAFVHTIFHDLETDVKVALAAQTLPWRDDVVALAAQVPRYTLVNEAQWMAFNKAVFGIFDRDWLAMCQECKFDVEVGPTVGRGFTLAMPWPDLAFGLAPASKREDPVVLTRPFLQDVSKRLGVHAYPCISANQPALVFPFLIFEAKSELGSMFEAQNQAAHGAAKALAMLRTLKDCYRQSPRAQASPPPSLPVVVICSQGHLWEVSVAFDLHDHVAGRNSDYDPSVVHVVSIWAGSVGNARGMLHLHSLLFRVLLWTFGTWRPAILHMLYSIA